MIHSFRNPELYHEIGVTRAEKDGNVVFVHDITEGLPLEYWRCDLIYSEPSWMLGYPLFMERAGTTGSFQEYRAAIAYIIGIMEIPVVLFCGKQSLRKFPTHDSECTAKLNGYKETAYAWRADISGYNVKDNEGLLECLANNFNRVGDFSCGYGVAGRAFKRNGKNFVASDINEKCVTYVARNVL